MIILLYQDDVVSIWVLLTLGILRKRLNKNAFGIVQQFSIDWENTAEKSSSNLI